MLNNIIMTSSGNVENKIFTGWDNKDHDGLQIKGKDVFVSVVNCFFHRKEMDPEKADELLSIVDGAKALIENCIFSNSGKGVLIGTGNTDEQDLINGQSATFDWCLFDSLSRRSPMVNAGNVVIQNCVIRNWGKTFFTKSYGARGASQYANLKFINCVFIQESFFSCLFRGHFWRDLFSGGGFWKGVVLNDGATAEFENCYKNRWWITGIKSTTMSKEDANKLIDSIINK